MQSWLFCTRSIGRISAMGGRTKGNIVSDLKHRKSAVVDVPGLAYFTTEAEMPANRATAPQPALYRVPQRVVLSALDQMYGYFGA